MAPDAEHADNNRPKCPSALHLTPLSTPSNRDPIHNEEAVISDSSLSQNNSHSIRSTPASSFSVQGGSPNTEAQSSALQPSEEIELSSISRHGSPGENQLQPISEDSSQCQNTSGIVIEGQHGDRGVHQRPVQQRPYTTSLQESLRTVSRYIPNYQKTSTIIALLALALTAFFGYETYVLAKLEVAAQIRQSCDEEKAKGNLGNVCKKVLDYPIGSSYLPDTSNIQRRMLESLRVSMSQSSISIIHPVLPFLGLVLSLSLVICRCMAPSLIGDFVHVVRQALRSLAFQPNASDPVPVSLAHPQPGDWSQATHGGGRRRVIHGIHEQSYEEYQYSRTRKRSFQPNIEMLLNVPYWKRRSLGSLEIRHKVPAPVTKVIRDNTTGQVGDALKGLAPDDLVLPKTITQSARRLLQKMAIFRDSDSDEDIEPPLTALLADSEPEQITKRNVTITSGLVALGLVQAGSTLASSVGGHIGPEILVKVETSDKMEKLGAMPSPSHCVLATGVDQ